MAVDFVSLLIDNPETKSLGHDLHRLLTDEPNLPAEEVQKRVVDLQRRITEIPNPSFNRSVAVHAIGQIAVNHK